MSAKQVLKLNMDAVTEDFFSDTAMIGIGSALPGYKFCWTINRSFDYQFVREPESDVSYKQAKNDEHYYSLYEYKEPYNGSRHALYKLRNNKNTLLPEIKQLDYLWLVHSQNAEYEVREIADILRDMPEIQLAQVIARERLKNLNHLIL